MSMTKPFVHKYQFVSTLVLGLLLSLVAQCAPYVETERITEVIAIDTKQMPETRVIATEEVPLNNCGGNSALALDIERSREFIYAVTDKDGHSLGAQYVLLIGKLEQEYNIINGEKETQRHTIHLETTANSHVIYTLAWKETWLNGQATVIKKGGDAGSVPFRVKKGLTLEVQKVNNFDCNSTSVESSYSLPDSTLCEATTAGWVCDFSKREDVVESPVAIEELDKEFEQLCSEQGGEWKCYGFCMATYPRYCDFPLADAGEPCTNSNQCSGLCIADFGTNCQENCKGKCSEYMLRPCDWYIEVVDGRTEQNFILCD